MGQTENRSAAINIRARPRQRDLIDRAAAMLDKPRSEFMLEAACREAENVLLDRRLFVLDEKTHAAFMEALEAPPADLSALRAMLEHKAPWES